MKAIIPVAGAGTRLRPLTYTQPKPLIPVGGKPIISYIIDQLVTHGVREFVFVIGYLGEKIKNYVNREYPDLHKEFVVQEKRLGTGHAIWIAKELIKDASEVIVFFGDVIIDFDLARVIKAERSYLAIKRVKDPREFGVVELDKDGRVIRLVEKPKIPTTDLAMVGFYMIRDVDALITALEFNINNNIRTVGEFPLTDALMRMVQTGVSLKTIKVDNWYDCGKKEVLLETNALLLEKDRGYGIDNIPHFENTIIIHPVKIGKDCTINNAIIGPHVTIGDNVMINRAIIRNSIIGNYASIKEINLHNSVVGNDAAITGLIQSLNIGDNTEIDFSMPQQNI